MIMMAYWIVSVRLCINLWIIVWSRPSLLTFASVWLFNGSDNSQKEVWRSDVGALSFQHLFEWGWCSDALYSCGPGWVPPWHLICIRCTLRRERAWKLTLLCLTVLRPQNCLDAQRCQVAICWAHWLSLTSWSVGSEAPLADAAVFHNSPYVPGLCAPCAWDSWSWLPSKSFFAFGFMVFLSLIPCFNGRRHEPGIWWVWVSAMLSRAMPLCTLFAQNVHLTACHWSLCHRAWSSCSLMLTGHGMDMWRETRMGCRMLRIHSAVHILGLHLQHKVNSSTHS